MEKVKVIKVSQDSIKFDDNIVLMSEHESDCCESHYLDFSDLKLEDFEGLEFDLTADSFFTKVEDYGIRLNPINGHSVSIPGYGYNNGYYSTNLKLELFQNDRYLKGYDITECQVINY